MSDPTAPRDKPAVVGDSALDGLAEVLRWKLNHLDPAENAELPWDALTDDEREIYRQCMKALLRANDDIVWLRARWQRQRLEATTAAEAMALYATYFEGTGIKAAKAFKATPDRRKRSR